MPLNFSEQVQFPFYGVDPTVAGDMRLARSIVSVLVFIFPRSGLLLSTNPAKSVTVRDWTVVSGKLQVTFTATDSVVTKAVNVLLDPTQVFGQEVVDDSAGTGLYIVVSYRGSDVPLETGTGRFLRLEPCRVNWLTQKLVSVQFKNEGNPTPVFTLDESNPNVYLGTGFDSVVGLDAAGDLRFDYVPGARPAGYVEPPPEDIPTHVRYVNGQAPVGGKIELKAGAGVKVTGGVGWVNIETL